MSYIIRTTRESDECLAPQLVQWYLESSQERGIGIAVRSKTYLHTKIMEQDAILALDNNELIGFCYIETFENKKYVSNSGLIVKKEYRGRGISKKIKMSAFNLARNKYPDAKIFGITTSDIVMKINTDLGYRAVAFHQLTQDDAFWNGCSSCPNFDILSKNNKKMCLCTGMVAKSKNQHSIDQKNEESHEEEEFISPRI